MLQLWLLGQFEAHVDGKRTGIPSRAAQSLLAYLILTAGTPHRREKLAGLLWPEMSDDNARNNLRHELWRVRKAITAPPSGAPESGGSEYILAEDLTIAFNPDADYWLDVAQIEKAGADPQSLISGLSLYRGELLPGFYDDWVGLERERVQAVFEGKMQQLLEALVAEQHWPMVLEWGERWIALGQTPEPAYRALMVAHSRLGDATKVALDYERCVLALRDDLNIAPSKETQALFEELKRGEKSAGVRFAPLPRAFIQPTGPLTCVFTEMAEAARLLQALGEDYAVLVQDQHELVRTTAGRFNGLEIDSQSDASFFGFLSVVDAVAFAAETQHAFAAHGWTRGETVRLRIGVHSSEPMGAGISMDLHRAARIASAAHGGQVLFSQTARELIGTELPEGLSLRDLGEHRLKELRYPTHLFQLVIAGLPNEFPPLKTLESQQEPPAPGEPPFKGLQYFDERDAALFFGREQLVKKLVGDLTGARFLAVIVGASGSGKSSVIRAGVIPALKGDGGNKGSWSVYIITPSAHPLEALATELTRNFESVTATATLLDDLGKDPRALHLWLRRQAADGPPSIARRVLVAVDQFEELFTLCRDEVEREMFIDSLLTATSPYPSANNGSKDNTPANFTLVITIRADFYAQLAQYPELREAVAKAQEYIGPMTTVELRRAIEEPANHGGWELEPGLVDLMLRDVGDEPGALPLLSHALLETWKRRSGHLMTLKGYAEAGGVRGAIAHTAETTFQQFSPEQQVIARGIFLRLTELGEATEDTRRRTSFTELIPQGNAGLATREVLTQLVDARLVTTGHDTAEVAHEALIREWPRLREWLSQDRESLRLHRQLTEAAQEWELLERDPGALYRGSRLAQAREWESSYANALNAHERAFLEASQAEQEREELEQAARQQRELDSAKRIAEAAQTLAAEQEGRAEETSRANRKLRLRALFLVGALALALALAGIALLFGDQARANALSAQQNASAAEQNAASANSARLQAELEKRKATARELAAAAIANLDVDPERSILLALQAVAATNQTDHAVMPEAEDALHRAVQTSRIFRTFTGLTKPNFIEFSPDETRLAVYGSGAIRLWDIASGKELVTLPVTAGNVDKMHFSRDATRLATTVINEDGTFPVATIFDLRTGAVLLKTPLQVPDYTYSDYSLDWTRIVVGSQNGTATLWDVATGKFLLTLAHPETSVQDVAFSPDGKRISTAHGDGTASVWDAVTGKELLSLRGHTEFIDAIIYNADGTRIGTASYDATAKVWDAATGKELLNLTGHGDLATDIQFSRDGTRILTTSLTRGGIVWDGQTGQMLTKLAGHTGFVRHGTISADGSRVVTSSSSDETIRVWDLDRSQELLSVATTAPLSTQTFVAGTVVYSPDGTQIAVGLRDGRVKIWNTANGREVVTLQGHTGPVHHIAYSPDGTRLASASSDKTARIWDIATGKELTVFRGHTELVLSVAFSPDGKRAASAGEDHRIQIWDVNSGEILMTVDTSQLAKARDLGDPIQNSIFWLAFSPDGQNLAVAFGQGTVSNWDLRTGKPLFAKEIGNGTWALVFNPDGSRLAMASIQVGAKVLNAATGDEILALGGTITPADSITYSHDGTRLATAHIGEAAAKIWDAATGKQLLTLYGDPSGVQSVDFSPDGSRLALASNNDVRIYLLRIGDLVELAKTRVTRSLTTEECNKYLHLDSCPVQ